MKHVYVCLLLCFNALILHAQTTVTITADRDNTLYSEDGSLSNGASDYLYVGRTGIQNNNVLRRSLVHFDLSSIPANAVINSVTVNFYCNNLGGGGGSYGIELHKASANWGEGNSGAGTTGGTGSPAAAGDATWTYSFFNTTLWSSAGGEFSATVSGGATISALGPVAISNPNLVEDVQSWVTNAASNFGWAITGSSEATPNSARRLASRETGTAAQRPQITINYTVSLPVTLQSFSVVMQQQNALVRWSTATEINNDHFIVEHSTDGQKFTIAGITKGSGNSTITRNYSFVHAYPPAGNNYYRLAQVDINGQVKYSAVQMVSNSTKPATRIFPNPVKTSLNVLSTKDLTGKTYRIFSASGQSVLEGIVSRQPIDVRQLQPGLYYFVIQVDGRSVEKLIFTK